MHTDYRALQAEIGTRLKALRVYRKMTQDYLAEQLGMSVPTLRKVEIGRSSLTATQLVFASRLLGVSCGVMAGEEKFSVSEPAKAEG